VTVFIFVAGAQSTATSQVANPLDTPSPNLPGAPFSVARPGSVFHFQRGQESHKIVVGEADGYFANYVSDGTPQITSPLNERVRRDYLAPRDVAEFNKIWPLAIGKSVHYQRVDPRANSRVWNDEISVVGTEAVKVGEKMIDTFVLRWHSAGEYVAYGSRRTSLPWEGSSTTWFAPSLGWFVKVKYSDNYNEKWEDQLTAYELGPLEAGR